MVPSPPPPPPPPPPPRPWNQWPPPQPNLPGGDFPLEIVCEILTRLPLKDLFRYKRVAHLFRGVIESEYFGRRYRSNSSGVFVSSTNKASENRFSWIEIDGDVKNEHVLVRGPLYTRVNALDDLVDERYLGRAIADIQVDIDDFTDNYSAAVSAAIPGPSHYRSPVMDIRYLRLCPVSSVRGLVLMYNSLAFCDLYLYNPLNREVFSFPHRIEIGIQSGECHKRTPFFTSFGLGADEATGDLKVVALCLPSEDITAQIYTLGTGHWRKLEGLSKEARISEPYAVLVNNRLNWLTPESESESGVGGILTFDLNSEEFELMPSCPFQDGFNHTSIGVVGNTLCVMFTKAGGPGGLVGDKFSVWTMNNYGEGASWANFANIQYQRPVGCNRVRWSARLVKSYDHKLLIELSDEVVLYDLSTNALLEYWTDYTFWAGVPFTPTLFSMKAEYAAERDRIEELLPGSQDTAIHPSGQAQAG